MVKSRSKKNYEVLMSALVIKKQLSVLYSIMHTLPRVSIEIMTKYKDTT
jgi:hypothetical protein